jgi:hypothetical protein
VAEADNRNSHAHTWYQSGWRGCVHRPHGDWISVHGERQSGHAKLAVTLPLLSSCHLPARCCRQWGQGTPAPGQPQPTRVAESAQLG